MNMARCLIKLIQLLMRDTTHKIDRGATPLHNHQNQKVDSITIFGQKEHSKSFFKKINIKLKWSPSYFKNLFLSSNLYQKYYLAGWLIFCSVLILIFILSTGLLILHQYSPSFSNIISFCIEAIIFLKCVFLLNLVSFIVGLVIEAYFIYTKDSKLLSITLSILGALSSFISLYFARWIIVIITGLEPATFSRALIILSIPIALVFWLCLSVLILSLVYYLSLISLILGIFLNTLVSYFYPSNSRTNSDANINNQKRKAFNGCFFFGGGRFIGATLLLSISLSVLNTLTSLLTFEIPMSMKVWAYSSIYSFSDRIPIMNKLLPDIFSKIFLSIYVPSVISLSSWINIAENIENIIVYADYRPESKVSECTNLKQGDWGLLIGYKKISVAKPQESGGYMFATESCLFEDST